MSQDPYILRYVGIHSIMFPSEDRDKVIEIAHRYGVDYLLMPANRPALDPLLTGDSGRSAFCAGGDRAGDEPDLLQN